MKKLLLLLTLSVVCVVSGFAKTKTLTATFEEPKANTNASYNAETGIFTWTGSQNNTMTAFRLEAGTLSTYEKLVFKTSDFTAPASYTSGNYVYRILFMNASGDKIYEHAFTSVGEKTEEISSITNWLNGGSADDVTEIRFAGSCNATAQDPASVKILAEDFYLYTDSYKEELSGTRYYLDLDENELNNATWDSATNTATWTSGGTNTQYVRFKVDGDVLGASMQTLTINLGTLTGNCRIYVVTADGKWTNVNSGITIDADGSDSSNTYNSNSSNSTISFSLANITSPIDYVMVKAARGDGEGKTYAINSINFNKPFELTYDKDGYAYIYPSDLDYTGCVSLKQDGTFSYAATESTTNGTLVATFNSAVDLSGVTSFEVNVEGKPNGTDYYEWIKLGTKAYYTSRYGATVSSSDLTAQTEATSITMNFRKPTNEATTFTKLNYIKLYNPNYAPLTTIPLDANMSWVNLNTPETDFKTVTGNGENYTFTEIVLYGETYFYFSFVHNGLTYYIHGGDQAKYVPTEEGSTDNTEDNSEAQSARRRAESNKEPVADPTVYTGEFGEISTEVPTESTSYYLDYTGVMNFKVTSTGFSTYDNIICAGVEEVVAETVEENEVAPVYYNLQGMRVANPEHGIYIRVQGNKAQKVAL